MKLTKISFIATLPLAILLTGCGDDTPTTTDTRDVTLKDSTKEALTKAKEATKETGKEIKNNTAEMWNSFSSYSVEKKDDAVTFLNNQANKLDEQIDELKADAKDAKGETKLKLEKGINTLAEKRRDLGLQIEKTKNATAETWESVKNETKEKWDDFTLYLKRFKNDSVS